MEQRTRLLHEFDGWVGDFQFECTGLAEDGARAGYVATAQLVQIAHAVARSLDDWRTRVEALEVGRQGPIDCASAGGLVLESIFDDALTPPASRVLAAALALAQE